MQRNLNKNKVFELVITNIQQVIHRSKKVSYRFAFKPLLKQSLENAHQHTHTSTQTFIIIIIIHNLVREYMLFMRRHSLMPSREGGFGENSLINRPSK